MLPRGESPSRAVHLPCRSIGHPVQSDIRHSTVQARLPCYCAFEVEDPLEMQQNQGTLECHHKDNPKTSPDSDYPLKRAASLGPLALLLPLSG